MFTFTVVVAILPFDVDAVIEAVPFDTGVIIPEAFTVTTAVLLLDQDMVFICVFAGDIVAVSKIGDIVVIVTLGVIEILDA